jgi:hypothetical protein
VKVHRSETFGGRHPVLSFVLLPFVLVPLLPIVVTLLVLAPFSQPWSDDAEQTMVAAGSFPSEADVRDMLRAYWSLQGWTAVVPAAVAVYFYRRARRRTLSLPWAWLAAAAAALSGALQHVRLGLPRDDRGLSLMVQYGGWPSLGPLGLAIAATALAAWLTRTRREHTDALPAPRPAP